MGICTGSQTSQELPFIITFDMLGLVAGFIFKYHYLHSSMLSLIVEMNFGSKRSIPLKCFCVYLLLLGTKAIYGFLNNLFLLFFLF